MVLNSSSKLVIISVHIHIQLHVVMRNYYIYCTSLECQNQTPGGYILDHSSVPRFKEVRTDSSVGTVPIRFPVLTSLNGSFPGRAVIERYIQRVLS